MTKSWGILYSTTSGCIAPTPTRFICRVDRHQPVTLYTRNLRIYRIYEMNMHQVNL